jgi:8-oxo-dGTP diphosphatase
MTDELKPLLVGIGVMILKEGKVLLGKRKGAHGAGEYAFPGGHLEHGESFAACALREVAEECGVEVERLRFQLLANVLTFLPKHYVLIGFCADWKGGDPQVLEPDKCEGWNWYALDHLPEPLFVPTAMMTESYRSKVNFLDTLSQK